MNYLLLTRDVLNVADIMKIVSADSCGAVSLFVGTTRDCFEEKKVLSLEYEAYEPMALKQMEAICNGLRKRWPDILNIAIHHRLGLVLVRESSVVIAISSPNRKSSLDAVACAIEELKRSVPIWKKEKYEDSGCSWKENKESYKDDNKDSLQFDGQICDVDDMYELPKQLEQISVDRDEIARRINCFVERKRNEVGLCNIMDYTEIQSKRYNTKEDDESKVLETSARVNSSIIKQEYSKGLLKVKRVENNVGPQMRLDYLNELDKLMISDEKNSSQINLSLTKIERSNYFYARNQLSKSFSHSAIVERLENIEHHLNISPSSMSDICKRLKIIEDRVLYLESISPEYCNFLEDKFNTGSPHCSYEVIKNGLGKPSFNSFERKIYNAADIDLIIHSFEN